MADRRIAAAAWIVTLAASSTLSADAPTAPLSEELFAVPAGWRTRRR